MQRILRVLSLAAPACKAITHFDRLKGVAKFAMLGMLVFLIGCAGTGSGSTQSAAIDSNQQKLHETMIVDLVSVLPQLLDPLGNTIQIGTETAKENAFVVRQLISLGYGLQRVDADQGSNHLRVIELDSIEKVDMPTSRLLLSVGDIELSREYGIVGRQMALAEFPDLQWYGDQAVVPISKLKLAGTRQAVEIVGMKKQLDFTAVEQELAEQPEVVDGGVQYSALAPIKGGIPTISLITNDIISRVAESASGGPSIQGLNSSKVEVSNLFYGGESTFESVLDNYNRIAREIVIFPNDSQRLGRPGKLIVRKLVSRFSENSDVIGIIGCSNGHTNLKIGNEGLALGRAQRITEELLSAGISPDKVFDEGCWSPTKNTRGFPNRGVVIDLWRRKA